MLLRSAYTFSAALVLSVGVYGQVGRPSNPGTGTGAPSNGGTGFPTTSRPPSSLPTTGIPTNPTTNPGIDRPIFLSGKVMLDDGTPPPEPVSIQKVCNTTPRTEGYTDAKGRFNFQLDRTMDVLPDASEDMRGRIPGASTTDPMSPQGLNSRNSMMGCELRASLAGFRSDTLSLTNHRSLDNPDVGTIVLHRLGNVEGLTISATTAMAPKDAKKAYEKALNDEKKEKWQDAEKELDKATQIYPKFAAAWYELGRLQREHDDSAGAEKSLAAAMAADPKYVRPYLDMAQISLKDRNWTALRDQTDRLLKLNPVDFPQAWYYNAYARYHLKEFPGAEKSVREGIKIDTEHTIPRMNQLLAVLLVDKRDYPGAAEALRNYLKVDPNGPEVENVKKQLAFVEQKMQANAAQPSEKHP